MKGHPDAQLVDRLRSGDESAFAEILDAWSGGMMRVARSMVGSTQAAEDVVQETWLAVIRSIRSFEGRSSLKTWVFRILVNTAGAHARRSSRDIAWDFAPSGEDFGPSVDPARFRSVEPWKGHWVEFPAPWPDPEDLALEREWLGVLEDALVALPPRQQLVIILRDVEGHSSEEVQEVLGVTAANQRVLLHRARAFVRGRLEEYFTSPVHPHPDARSKNGGVGERS